MPQRYVWYVPEARVGYVITPRSACTSLRLWLAALIGYPVITRDEQLATAEEIRMHSGDPTEVVGPAGTLQKEPYTKQWRESHQQIVTFTFVRHPLSRLISLYRGMLRPGEEGLDGNFIDGVASQLRGPALAGKIRADMPFEEFVAVIAGVAEADSDIHYMQQVHRLIDPQSRRLMLDYVGRVEHFAKDLLDFQAECDLHARDRAQAAARRQLPERNPHKLHVNRSRDDGPIAIDQDVARLIAERYAGDLEAFEYLFLRGRHAYVPASRPRVLRRPSM